MEERYLSDEEIEAILAKKEFGDNIICLLGKEKPLEINSNIQCISNGKGWTTLIDALKQLYPSLEFETDDRFMNIKVKEYETN